MYKHSGSEKLHVLGLTGSDLELARKSELVSLALRAGKKIAMEKPMVGRKNA